MLAKVIATGPSRAEAAARLAAALEGMRIQGLRTNRDQLAAILRDPDFLAGATRTDFLDLHPELAAPADRVDVTTHLAAAIAVSVHRRRTAAAAEAERHGVRAGRVAAAAVRRRQRGVDPAGCAAGPGDPGDVPVRRIDALSDPRRGRVRAFP